jgi:hypothetical protein
MWYKKAMFINKQIAQPKKENSKLAPVADTLVLQCAQDAGRAQASGDPKATEVARAKFIALANALYPVN